MSEPFYTIGHSTRAVEAFTDLLRAAGVGLLVDVRSMPRSRTNPQFNLDSLPQSLDALQIGYRHIAALGGLRGKQRPAEASANDLWRVKSFRNYADYAQGPVFAQGLDELRRLGGARRCAIMCAEAVWWRCHRRIIADYLLAAGETVFHILGPGNVEPATLTPGAQPTAGGVIDYPAAAVAVTTAPR